MELEDEEGLHAPEEEEVPVVKKRRGKKKKRVIETFLPLPDEATEGLSPEIKEELQLAYNILQTIMGISRIQPFLEKPNENLFGMASYYNIIKRPMWLLEVQRKLLSKEYEDISGFVADIRLILENCYRFWGPTHKFSGKALFVEHKLEVKLALLPEHIREKCLDPDYSKEVEIKTEIHDDLEEVPPPAPIEKKEPPPATTTRKGFESKILNKILESDEPEDSEDIEEQKLKEAEMLNWEREHLVSETQIDQIKSMWQLAEIGSFLKLTSETLNVEEITQYEVERMLLMPKESMTLATLMTSMLSPQVIRSQLDDKPVMPYEIWTSRLKKRIENWFSIFYKSGDEIEAFSLCGVEPGFWASVNLMNPLETNYFHEISFYQRVWILKSLCNHLMHTDKPIQDVLLDEANIKELRPIRIGNDKKGNLYFRIPFFREIRVYKQTRLPDKTFQAKNDAFLSSIFEATTEIDFNDEENELELLPSKNDCILVADSVESLTEFIEELKEKDLNILAKHFTKQLKFVKKERRSIEGLVALYTQWHDFQNRSQEYFNHILKLWVSNEKKPQIANETAAKTQEISTVAEVLGKRRSKRSFAIDFTSLRSTSSSERSSGEGSSDVSDWESTYRKKKKKVEKKKIHRRASSESSDDLSKQEVNSTLSIQSVVSLKQGFDFNNMQEFNLNNSYIENGESVIIDSDKEDSKIMEQERAPAVVHPQENSIQCSVITSNTNLPHSVSALASTVSVSNSGSAIILTEIKKEKDDVIYISSDEEKEANKRDSDVSSSQNRANNGIIPSVHQVQVPLRTPSPNKSPVIARTRNIIQSVQQTSVSGNPQVMPSGSRSQPAPTSHVQQMPKPIPVPMPIPAPQRAVPAPIPLPMPIPASPVRQMPLPIPEPAMPQPMVDPSMPQPKSSPQPTRGNAWGSPRANVSSPRTPRGISPRLRSPLTSPQMRTPSPRGSPMGNLRPGLSPRSVRNPAVRNLFPAPPSVPSVEGVLEIGQKPDGSYGYHVRLPDGGIINMTRIEIDEIRRKNNGVLPVKIDVPLKRKV